MKLLTVTQLCELLQVKKDWVYDQVQAGQLPHVRIGRHLRFPEDAIQEWIRSKLVA